MKRIRFTDAELAAVSVALSMYLCGDMADAALQEGDPEDEKKWEAACSADVKVGMMLSAREKKS